MRQKRKTSKSPVLHKVVRVQGAWIPTCLLRGHAVIVRWWFRFKLQDKRPQRSVPVVCSESCNSACIHGPSQFNSSSYTV